MSLGDIDWNQLPPPKCKHCRHTAMEHKAGTKECPRGMKTRIGYTSFGPTTFEAREPKKKAGA